MLRCVSLGPVLLGVESASASQLHRLMGTVLSLLFGWTSALRVSEVLCLCELLLCNLPLKVTVIYILDK